MWPFKRERPVSDYQRRKVDLLAKAASSSEVVLVCHPDTWQFIVERCSEKEEHFSAPTEEAISAGEDGRVRVPVSGRTLAAILSRMTFDAAPVDYVKAINGIATHVKDSITSALEGDHPQEIVIDAHPNDQAR
ncbi:hypothetical protein [Streptomyces sp. NBRC 109706]|uniref:hypothetical protein n=1 Tax=Streptomyces sp. NBRC 109706 TaxID=1550035 RepID=UPI000784C06E|nr:hypothetical protein [Streptomyces sp. NBRC 109706]